MKDKRYWIELEVLTPLHIGTGSENDWVRGADYAQKDGKVYVIDIRKAVEKGIDVSSLFASKDQRSRNGIEEIDSKRLENIAKYVFASPQSTNNDIKSCLRNQFLGTPVIAGSSIKGAIRSVLFNHLGGNYLIRQRGNQSKDSQLVKHIFGDMNVGTDFMRFLRIPDVVIPREKNDSETPGTILVNTKLFNLQNNNPAKNWHGGWKNSKEQTEESIRLDQFNTLYECIEPGKKGEGSIILARSNLVLLDVNLRKIIKEDINNIYYAEEKKRLINNEINDLFKIINKATKKYLEEEEAFFNRYDEADHANDIVEGIRELKKLIPNEDCDTGNYCLLKMSAGVGFHAITGNWVYDDFIETGTTNGKADGKKNKKSRKIAIYKGYSDKPYLTGYELMGFVKLRIISEIEQKYEKLVKEANVFMKSEKWEEAYKKVKEADSIDSSREDHKQILKQCKEKKEEADKKAEEQRTLINYNKCIDEANKLKNAKKWNEAKLKAESAEKLNEKLIVKQFAHHRIIEECDGATKYSKTLSEVIANSTSSVGNVIGTTKTWTKNHSFEEKEYTILRDTLKKVKNLKEKDLKKEIKKISFIGEDMTNRLINDLFPPQAKVVVEKLQKPEEKLVVPVPDTFIESTSKETTEQEGQPDIAETNEHQAEQTESEGVGNKILKWFKNLFK